MSIERNVRSIIDAEALAATLVLLANDLWLKAAFPSFLTGKLSDFAGLFLVGRIGVRLWPCRRVAALVTIAVAFTWWKLPVSGPIIRAWNGLGVWPLSRVVDLTDLLALAVLPFALTPRIWRTRARWRIPATGP